MSVLNCIDDSIDCPLCMEPLEIDDLNFFPCTCGYQICRFCWHRIRTDENGLCPACRKAYPENPADFKPLSQEELQNIKQEKRQRDLQRKQKVTENRKHLANVRVVQKNLVFVVGLSSRLADPETLKKCDYFGKFGKIVKVVINHSTTYAGSQGPSASAYVTYQRAEDALRAIQAVNNIHVDGRILKASLGTTKYCSHFMKNQSCPKSDCMYLHELGDESASFTKEEMQQGKHQEFEKRLQEQYLGSGTAVEKLSSLSSSSSPVLETEIPPLGSIITTNGSTATGGTNSKKNNNNSNHVKDQNHPNNQKNSTADKTGAEPKEGWPTLVSASTERQGSKRSRTKSERNSNRQTPTEENNKRNNRDREKKNGVLKENGIVCNDDESSSASGPHSQSSLSSTPSMQDSCTSSASATPPPLQGQDCIASLPTPPRSASSPMPVTAVSGHRSERDSSSPVGTTPSSLSSCSDFSSSLPTSQQSQSVASSSVPQSLFSNSFFSNRSVNPLHENSLQTLGEEQSQPQVMQQPRPEETLSHSEQQSQHISYTNGDQNNLSSSWTLQDHLAQSNSDNCSTSRWNAMFEYDSNSEFKNPTVIDQKADDDLGFDPFEETNKALAEDILMERRQEQLHQKHLLMQQQLLQQKQLEQQQQQQLMLQNGLKHLLDGYSTNGHGKDIQGRLPPPGFNGMSTLGGFLPSQPQNFNKMMPGYVGNLPSNPSNGSPQLSGLMGSNRVGGIPPGLNTNILTNLHGGIGSHQLSGPSVMALDGHNVSQAPPGLGISKTNDPFVFKDLDNGLSSIRNVFPGSMNSVSTMNTVNTLNSLAVNNPQGNISSQNNPLSNFLNMAQQRQQTHQFPSHQNLIQQLGGSNMLQQTQKGWSSGVNTDLTSIDPAIVSSGQLTDSRSDSPPMWLKSVDSHDIGMALGSDGGSWGNIPYNLISGTLQASLGNMHPGNMMGALNGPQNTRRSNNMWPPTSPPPGFNSISPLQAKQREGHKIENL